jgi:methyl-accepting chemotaxis protein
MQNLDSQTIQLAIVAAVAITMLLQAIALLAILVVVRKSVRSMRDEVEGLRTSITGVIEKVEPVLDNVRADLAAMSANLCRQSNDVQTTATEIAERFRRQSARVDQKLTSIFDVLDRATNVMSEAVSKPMRQLAGILASAKAVMETLRNGAPESHTHEDHTDDEKDIYI